MNKLKTVLLVATILLIICVAGYYASQVNPPTVMTASITETKQFIEIKTEERLTTIVNPLMTETKQLMISETERKPITFVTISAIEAKQLIENGPEEELMIVDVRPSSAYVQERIEGAINIPILQLREGVEMPEKNNTILVYSQTGVTGSNASQILINNGFTQVYNMDGGFKAWINEDFPVVSPKVIESTGESLEGCGCK
jgi:rhodanese-related sulfurtransferase